MIMVTRDTLSEAAKLDPDTLTGPISGPHKCSIWVTPLVEKSLLIADRRHDETRYRLLESTRYVALDQLVFGDLTGYAWTVCSASTFSSITRAAWATSIGRFGSSPLRRLRSGICSLRTAPPARATFHARSTPRWQHESHRPIRPCRPRPPRLRSQHRRPS
jgi:hypothetical protein